MDKMPENRGNWFVTDKEDKEKHGVGLHNIEEAVKRNNGLMHINVEEHRFAVEISLIIPMEEAVSQNL